MAHQSRIVIICVALILATACNKQPANQQTNAPTPAGPAAAVAANTYKGVGVVKGIHPKPPAIEIDHQDIEGLMPAMQMEFPVTDPSILNGIAVNDHIDFTIEAAKGEMKVTAIKKK
ncbi:MAG TPA: copper-binding protein [Pyrinomonadaceae bacterium]|nr:copper-binding protein [Pyrinomonadaceae bacterium]